MSYRTKPSRTSALCPPSRTNSTNLSLSAPLERTSEAHEASKGDSCQNQQQQSCNEKWIRHDWLKGAVRCRIDCDETRHRDGERGQTTQRIFVTNSGSHRKLSRTFNQRAQHTSLLADGRSACLAEFMEQHIHTLPVRSSTHLLQERFTQTHKLHIQGTNLSRKLSHTQSARWQNVWNDAEECTANVLWDAQQMVRFLFPFELE